MPGGKEMRELVRRARKAGCEVQRLKNGHTRVTAPNGASYDLSFSPGTSRGVHEQQVKMAKFFRVNGLV